MDAEAREKNIEEETKDEQQQQQQLEERPNEGGTEGVDVNKTLYDAEEFLTNFSGLRLENDQLKRNNDELQSQLAKAQQDLQQLLIDKDNLEANLQQEREEHKEELWKIRGEIQKVQEERLQWKEKYLNIYMKINDNESSSTKSRKRKSGLPSDSEEFFTNLSSTYGLTNQDEHPEEGTMVTLLSEDSKTIQLSIRECQHCGVTCAIPHQEHLLKCRGRQKLEKTEQRMKKQAPLECLKCRISFDSFDKVEQHNQYHTGLHPYLCEQCGWSFRTASGRQKHSKRRHSEVELMTCEFCAQQFKRKDHFKHHIAVKHSDITPHRCPFCEDAFKCREFLRDHVKRMHPGKTIAKMKTDVNVNASASNGDGNTKPAKDIKIAES